MVKNPNLEKYIESLPKSMTLKKKVVRAIMKSEKPLTQKDILDVLNSTDWTNIRRILRDLLDEGLVVKKFIGTKEYYVKVDLHGDSQQFEDEDLVYFMDIFEPEFKGEEKYIRIKQSQKVDLENYETLGKVTIRLSKLKDFIEKLKKLEK